MFGLGSTTLGITLLAFGLILLLLTYLLLRLVPKRPIFSRRSQINKAISTDPAGQQDPVFVIEPGGWISYLNQAAREYFEIWESEPNLEVLARRARPRDIFLSLCAVEGQARLSMDGHPVEAHSYFIPNHLDVAQIKRSPVLLTIRPQQSFGLDLNAPENVNRIIEILTELNLSMRADLALESTLTAILESVEQLLPTDISEITLWDPANETLVPYRFNGAEGLERQLTPTKERYPLGVGLVGQVAERLEPLVVGNEDALDEFPLPKRAPFRSFLGVPLKIGEDLIGTLSLMSQGENAYTQNDIQTLTLVAGQAAIAVHNALTYQEEQRRADELASLASLSRAINAAQDSEELFNHLIQGITPILDVEIAGFLIYDQVRSELRAVNPFIGVPSQYVAVYIIPIPMDSPAEKIWLSGKTIVTSTASEDPRMVALGFDHHSRATGIHNTAIIQLAASGRSIGYLQVANKRDGTLFSPDDLNLLEIVAHQAGAIIENANLIRESVGRALRAESLRRIASLTGSNATLDEILKYSLVELARLIQADLAGIFLLDESLGELQVHPGSLYGIQSKELSQIAHLPIQKGDFRRTVTASKRPFISGDVSQDERVLPTFTDLIEPLKVRAVIDVPIISRERGLGEILLCSHEPDTFNQGDVQLAATVAGQIAVALEHAQLAAQSDPYLHRQVSSLTALTRIGRVLTLIPDLSELCQTVLDEAVRNTRARSGCILLLDENSPADNPKVILGLGTPQGHQLTPLEQAVFLAGTFLLIPDFNHPPRDEYPHLDTNHWQPPQEGIRSALILPMVYEGHTNGLIHLHAVKPNHFDEADLAFCQALALQAGLASHVIRGREQQTQQLADLNHQVGIFDHLLKTNPLDSIRKPLTESLTDLAVDIQTSTPFNQVVFLRYEPADDCLHYLPDQHTDLTEYPEQENRESPSPIPWQDLGPLMQPKFSRGVSYRIPYNQRPNLTEKAKAIFPAPDGDPTSSANKDVWHPKDIWMIPLFDSFEKPLGIIQFSEPLDLRQPDQNLEKILGLYATQVATLIDSHQHHTALETQIKQLTKKVSQYEDTNNQTPRLMGKIEEQEVKIQDLAESNARIIAGLGVIDGLNLQPDREAVLAALGEALINQLRMSHPETGSNGRVVAMVAEYGPGGPQLIHILGATPGETHPEALLGQRNPLSACLQNGISIFVSDSKDSEDWSSSPLLVSMQTAGFICLPIMSGPHPDAAILVISRLPLPLYSDNDKRLFELLAIQAENAINNIHLLMETSHRLLEVNLLLDFSRQLGTLEPRRILQSLIDISMQVAESTQAGFVALLDPKSGNLIPQAARGYRDSEALIKIKFQADTLPGKVCAAGQAIRIDDLDFAQSYPLNSNDLMYYRQATGGILPVSCNMIPIQSGGEPLGVIVLDNFKKAAAFSVEDQAMVTSLAQQTALSLENARLYQAAERRVNQLQALSLAVTTITPTLEPDELVESLLIKLGDVVPYETATLWELEGNTLSILAIRGFDENETLAGISTSIQDSRLFQEMAQTGRPLVVDDIRLDNRFPPIDTERLSWLGIPLFAKEEMTGAITLEKKEAGFYSQEDIQAATTFASQAAIALENATLYQQSLLEALELDQRSQRLAMFNRFSNQISSVLDPVQLLEITLREMTVAVPANVVSGILIDGGKPVLQAEIPLYLPGSNEPTPLPEILPESPIFERMGQTLGIFYSQDVWAENELESLSQFFEHRETQAILILPLYTGKELNGLVIAHNDQNYHYTTDEIELALILTNQAAVAIQNAISFEATTRLTEELEARVLERTAQLELESQREQSLMSIMRELSASLDLDQVLNQTLVILNETIGAQHSSILLINPEEQAFYCRASIGNEDQLPPAELPSSIKLDEGLTSWVVSNREGAVIGNTQEDDRWTQVEDDSPGYVSVISVPLVVGEDVLGVVILGHPEANVFSTDDQDLAQAAAMQMAVAINNAELFNLIRDQAEGLGTMLRSQQVEASRSMAILEAVADGVLVTDDQSQITLFNPSAQRILSLRREDVIGKSLEGFPGLFGHAAQTWMDTIRNWASDPSSHVIGETYAEQITLDNERVVAIHLAPVIMGSEFLGTVTIFRDITHQVEVDQLKTEFVATVSHELRTPMTSIKGYVDILLMGAAGVLTEQQTQFLNIVKSNTERLNALVNDLLDVSRIETGKVKISIQPQDIRILIQDVIRNQKRQSKEDNRPMSFNLELPDSLSQVPCDEERIRQVLDNLVRNAYLYTPVGGRINIRVLELENEVQIDIQDNGIGIHPDDHERIFERFYRGEHSLVLASGGNGLGLSISRQLVEMHHGRLWLESQGIPGEGSTFSFSLPLEPPN